MPVGSIRAQLLGAPMERKRENTMANLRLGIVGCGGIANQKHLPSIAEAGGADVVAFCDIIP